MSNTTPRIFLDVEEALSREVRRITFHENRTLDKIVLQDTYDPFDGSVIKAPIQSKFYDSSADAHHIQYPNFFIRLMKTREDRFTGRVVPEYGNWLTEPVNNSSGAYQIITSGIDGLINTLGNNLNTTIFTIRRIQPGFLLRLLSGNNKGTYIVNSITPNISGNHAITISNILINNLPSILFDPNVRKIYFQDGVDLSTVKLGDIFTDSISNTYNITAIDTINGTINIDGSSIPSLLVNSFISRSGNVFENLDTSYIRFLVMDPSQPIKVAGLCGEVKQKDESTGVSPPIPIDAYYLIRIDSKTRENHIDVLNRVWEEFNPPRTALPVIQRTSLSAEQEITSDIPLGGSSTVPVTDNSNFSVGDKVFIFDDLHPTKKSDGEGFERPFESMVIGKPSATQLLLADVVPDSFKFANTAKIVSNCEFKLFMFNFQDHVTKDVEGSQYWVHEFTFWIQFWVDRLGGEKITSNITEVIETVESFDGNIIIDDN